jgi:tetratricopeptide (TPR) repeat protein
MATKMQLEPRSAVLIVLRPLLVVLALVACSRPSAGQQSPRTPAKPTAPAVSPALRALLEGRYDDVDRLTRAAAATDPDAAALEAQAQAARGRYDDALKGLESVAARAPQSDAALQLGLLRQLLGRPDAEPVLQRVAAPWQTTRDPEALARAARALQALNEFQEANSAFRDASAARPADPAINTAWGELFLAASNRAEALKSFKAALEADPRWTPALIGAARALAEDDQQQALAAIKQALEVNPSSVEAHVFLAARAVDADHDDQAREAIKQALAVNPNSLDAHSLLAAMAYVHDDKAAFDAEVKQVLAIAPHYGEVYRVAGEQAAANYRFEEAVALTRQALELDPDNPRALSDLGLHLLRTGDEPAARQALEASFKLYPYDVVTFNLLGMMDTLDTFVTVKDGDLILRMNKDEAPVLQGYVLALAHKALDRLAELYQFTPKGPILIEMFSKHDDFAVRNLGLPGMIGALGACFGHVVTLDSPRAQPPGTFQWEATLWHELAHVITIQLSNERVPRWLTEGISVFEQKRQKKEWARPGAVEFAQLLEQGHAIKLADLNQAFLSGETISLAYYESSLLVEYIVKTYGDAGMRRLLVAYGEGLDTDHAMQKALGASLAEMQSGFDRAMDEQFGTLRRAFAGVDLDRLPTMPLAVLRAQAAEHPGNYPVEMTLGHDLKEAGRLDEATQAFEKAAEAVPVAIGDDSPHAQLAQIAIEQHDDPRALKELQAQVAVDFDNVDAARQLAKLMREQGIDDPARIRQVNERIVAVDPFDGGAHAVLGQLAMKRDDPQAAAQEFQAVLALKPVDQAAAHTDLAESYLALGRRDDARTQTLRALEIAPTYQRAQNLLLELVDGGHP